ncbi:hypothetical protein B0O99DRAFT_638810 [Bisporella sp. PMI_857]|nr:hypothetical protein B0O99DRAFT_638810 [Bisporella sp. PMI_857]
MRFLSPRYLSIALAALEAGVRALPSSIYAARHFTRAEDIEASYDYVIIGGGTAGLTVADRLTEDPKTTVLVIEYGYFQPPIDPDFWIPGGWRPGAIPRSYFYNITAIGTKPISVLAGCAVGGSSAVNAMVFMRGTSEDYDRWATLGGKGSTWNWKGLLPYFKKAANFTPPRKELVEEFGIKYDEERSWGQRGPIEASFPSFLYPGLKTMLNAWKSVPGVNVPTDGSAGEAGLIWVPTSLDPKNVTRSYARPRHYERVKSRPNYHLLTGHGANKIEFRGQNGAILAHSVIITPRDGNGTSSEVLANREIILSAGAINSPYILFLSGIGDRAVIEKAGIQTVRHIPGVGHNLHDHSWFSASWRFQNDVFPSPGLLSSNATFEAWARELWNQNRTGPYSIIGANAMAMLPLSVLAPNGYEALASDLEAQKPAAFLPPGTDASIIKGYAAQQRTMAAAIRSNNTAFIQFPLSGAAGGALFNMHPLSRGSVTLNTSYPLSGPVVDYRALSNPLDMHINIVLLQGIRNYFALPALEALAPIEVAPGANVTSFDAMAEFISRTLGPSAYHNVGTCAKMPLEFGGVVDESLKVHGLRKLRVVDASVIPILVGGTTQSTVYALAEKAADLIKNEIKG